MASQSTVDEDPPDISFLDQDVESHGSAPDSTMQQGVVIGYRRVEPPPPEPPKPLPVGLTVQQARIGELKSAIATVFRPIWNVGRWIVFGIGSALLSGGLGMTLQRAQEGPIIMAVGGFLVGINLPRLLRRSN
jgi:hypothetical protein